MSAPLAVLGLLSALSGAAPPRDPYLPPSLTEVVEKAHQAEVDPKRGMSNAMDQLKAERAKRPHTPRDQEALDLRVAGTILRSKFMTSDEFPEALRYVQALSTYSRLDLWEPGLKYWLDKSLERDPTARAKVRAKNAMKIKVGILLRGSSLDREEIARAFKHALEKVGASIEVVPVKEAAMVLTFAAEDATREQTRDKAVQLGFGAERVQDGKVVWRTSLYRVEAAQDPKVALASALEWIARIGGRDIYFRWLGELAFPILGGPPTLEKGIAPAGHHDHAPVKVKIPQKSP